MISTESFAALLSRLKSAQALKGTIITRNDVVIATVWLHGQLGYVRMSVINSNHGEVLTPRGLLASAAETWLKLKGFDVAACTSWEVVDLSPVSDVAKPEDDRETFIYFLQGPIGGPIKIGKADDVDDRLREIQRMSPVRLSVLATIRGKPSLERELHRRFAAARSHGEWFDATPELMVFIESVG